MFRLMSLLIVIAILGILAAVVADSLSGGGDCEERTGPTTTLPVKVSKGIENLVTGC